jgi:Periplasmic copper-binding protein (NosD)
MKRIFIVGVLAMSLFARAKDVNVNCHPKDPAGKISKALGLLNPLGPNSITVSGTCRDNVFMVGYDRLSLIAKPGATITDASGGQQWALIYVVDSRRISIQGFTLSGGNAGIACNDASLCRLSGNIIEGTLQRGVDINTSDLTFNGDTVQNNAGIGIYVNASNVQGTNLVIQGNSGTGVTEGASTLVGDGWNVSNNGNDGVFVATNSHFQLVNSSVTSNAWNGIDVTDLADVSLEGDTVTANGYSGVRFGDQSLGYFDAGTYTGNGLTYALLDIGCYGNYIVTHNLQSITYGTTNCTSSVGAKKRGNPGRGSEN